MENKFTAELIEKAKQVNSAEELTALAKENGVDISEDDAREYFEQMNRSGELSDDEIEEVTGGAHGRTGNFKPNNVHPHDYSCDNYECSICGSRYYRHICEALNLWLIKSCRRCKYATKLSSTTYLCNFDSQ